MTDIKIAEKSFEDWAELAQTDPSAFEAMRLAAIDRYIEGLPPGQQKRMRQLQWRIDQERNLARTPMHACIRISRMMWDNILGRGGLQERFAELGDALRGDSSRAAAPQADVLCFRRAGESREF